MEIEDDALAQVCAIAREDDVFALLQANRETLQQVRRCREDIQRLAAGHRRSMVTAFARSFTSPACTLAVTPTTAAAEAAVDTIGEVVRTEEYGPLTGTCNGLHIHPSSIVSEDRSLIITSIKVCGISPREPDASISIDIGGQGIHKLDIGFLTDALVPDANGYVEILAGWFDVPVGRLTWHSVILRTQGCGANLRARVEYRRFISAPRSTNTLDFTYRRPIIQIMENVSHRQSWTGCGVVRDMSIDLHVNLWPRGFFVIVRDDDGIPRTDLLDTMSIVLQAPETPCVELSAADARWFLGHRVTTSPAYNLPCGLQRHVYYLPLDSRGHTYTMSTFDSVQLRLRFKPLGTTSRAASVQVVYVHDNVAVMHCGMSNLAYCS